MTFTDNFKEISPYEVENALKLIGKDWMLITVKDGSGANAMTASWGCLGVLWNKPVAVCFIRPQRYTRELLQVQDTLSLAFFGQGNREALRLCGSKSGRDCDKLKETGLSFSDVGGTPIINEAELVIVGKKLYVDRLREDGFLEKDMLDFYKEKDFHEVYVLEIQNALVKK